MSTYLFARIRKQNLEIEALRERALRAEALVRAKDETIGELLDLIYDDADNYWVEFDKWLEEA